jgi:hypothetical protein
MLFPYSEGPNNYMGDIFNKIFIFYSLSVKEQTKNKYEINLSIHVQAFLKLSI